MYLLCKVKGTVILKIWPHILFFGLWTAGVLGVHNFVEDVEINFPQSLIPILGVVIGLLLVFRTNTAYDRYYEGRKIWSVINLNIRNLTRYFWVSVRSPGKGSRDTVEKLSAINLLVAFAYATKNHLRGQYSYHHERLAPLISHLPKIASKTIPEHACPLQKNFKAYDNLTPTNIPIEISFHIAAYIKSRQDQGLTEPPTLAAMNTALNSLVDCLGGFERILRTPIPLAYSVHLRHSILFYLLALPFQLIGAMNWFALPAVILATFTLLGILCIGWEIENPFGYDENDLPVDDFCDVIHTEVLRMVCEPVSSPDEWMFTEDNRPCAPVSQLTAKELCKMESAELKRILQETADEWVERTCKTKGSSLNGVKIEKSKTKAEEQRPMIPLKEGLTSYPLRPNLVDIEEDEDEGKGVNF